MNGTDTSEVRDRIHNLIEGYRNPQEELAIVIPCSPFMNDSANDRETEMIREEKRIADLAKNVSLCTGYKKGNEGGPDTPILEIDVQKFVTHFTARHDTIAWGDKIWLCKNNQYYEESGELLAEVTGIARALSLQKQVTKYGEIVSMLSGTNFFKDSPFNRIPGYIPVKNGVIKINMATGEVSGPYSNDPAFRFTYAIGAEYNPAAGTGNIERILKEWVDEKYAALIPQIIAQGIFQSWADVPFKKAYLFQGEKSSAKTSCLTLLRRFFTDNSRVLSSVSIHDMSLNKFSLASMENRILNLYDELDREDITNLTRFKSITGGCWHEVEEKFKSSRLSHIFCSHVFACNTPPKIPEELQYDAAFWDRWEFIPFTNMFPVDPTWINRTFTDELMCEFLNLVLKSLSEIIRTNKLIAVSDPDEVRERWTLAEDPLKQFIDSETDVSPFEYAFSKKNLFKAYSDFFDTCNIDPRKRITSLKKFTHDLQKLGFVPKQIYVDNPDKTDKRKRFRVWAYSSKRVWRDGQIAMEPSAADREDQNIS